MWLRFIVLAKQVFTIVITIWRSDDGVNMLSVRYLWIDKMTDTYGQLMIELYQNNWALNTVIENGLLIKTADPGEMGLINIFCHLFHSYSGMTIAQIIYN